MLRLILTLGALLNSCQKDETISGYAVPGAMYWVQTIGGEPFAARANITFPQPGQITGEAPCNQYEAKQTLPYPWFNIEALAATKRACPDLGLEAEFFKSLASMTLVEVSGSILLLSNDAGSEMVFRIE